VPVRSGFYIPPGRSVRSTLYADDEVQAARFFPSVRGATVLHVHYQDGRFVAGGRRLTAGEFNAEVVQGLDLPAGQLLIIVACNTAGLGESAAATLAQLGDRPVLAATKTAFTMPNREVVTASFEVQLFGLVVIDRARPGDWVVITPDGVKRAWLGPDLLGILRSGSLDAHLPGQEITVAEADELLPPVRAVRWNQKTGHAISVAVSW
jgi:hypothetical protein